MFTLRSLMCVFTLALLFLVACNSSPAPAAAPDAEEPPVPGPNVLLLVADDLGWADLNCYGNPLVETPNIDALARRGTQFMQAYAAAADGRATRSSLQTGLYPARTGSSLLGQETMGELAQRAGYFTAHVGKWDLDDDPLQHGYDRAFAACPPPDSFYYAFYREAACPDLLAATKRGDYLTDVLTDHTLDILQEWQGNQWLIALNFYAPHVPIQGRKDWVQRYQELVNATHYRKFPRLPYAAMVSTIDENVGRIVRALEASGELDNTFIVLLSDNGGLANIGPLGQEKHTPPTDNGILRGGKGDIYEGGIRIPFIVHYPAIGTDFTASQTPVITNDVFPTLAELFGRNDYSPSPDGRSLLPLLTGEDPAPRTLFWEDSANQHAAARRGVYKMHTLRDTAYYFHLEHLPDESRTLAAPPADLDLARELDEWSASFGRR